LPPAPPVERSLTWDEERRQLLGRRISDLGLEIRGTRVERLVERLYDEMHERGLVFRPTVYLSDQWGCPDGTPIIGVPFYLASAELERIESEQSGAVEGDEEAMRYLRHEAGHAVNYAFRVYERPDFAEQFGDYARPYAERYSANPMSRDYVRHILGWYAQKHPDEDFAESFAVWLTPTLDWRTEYSGWPALRKLEWVDALMQEIAALSPSVCAPSPDDLPVESMHWTVAEHYADADEDFPVDDARQFDADLLRVFARAKDAPMGESAAQFLTHHEGELVTRIAYWTGEGAPQVRSLARALSARAARLDLRVSGLEAATLIELTAFGTAVMMHWRYARVARSSSGEAS
jgi:hypothetical protein